MQGKYVLCCPFFLLSYDLKRLLKYKSVLWGTKNIILLADHCYAMIQEITRVFADFMIYNLRGQSLSFG